MTRVPQPAGTRGSLRWIQAAVGGRWPSLEEPVLAHVDAQAVDWRSPLASDSFAEYRDGAFLEVLGLGHLAGELRGFWPRGGPQWDALGVADNGAVLLVEAKAHVREMCSPGTAAGARSRALIEQRLAECAALLGASERRAAWADHFYQLANRLAHLHFLRANGVPAHLVLVNFVGDGEMGGPTGLEAWRAAYEVAFAVMGLGRRHALSRFVLEVYPDVRGAPGCRGSPGHGAGKRR